MGEKVPGPLMVLRVDPLVNDSRAFWSEVNQHCVRRELQLAGIEHSEWSIIGGPAGKGGPDDDIGGAPDTRGAEAKVAPARGQPKPYVPLPPGWGYRCKYPDCKKTFRTTDGVRKHARKQHWQWLESVAPGKKNKPTSFYCELVEEPLDRAAL